MRVSTAYYLDEYENSNACDNLNDIIILFMVFLQISILYVIYPILLFAALAFLIFVGIINCASGKYIIPIRENTVLFFAFLALLSYLGILTGSLVWPSK
jgi:hypothetical protein